MPPALRRLALRALPPLFLAGALVPAPAALSAQEAGSTDGGTARTYLEAGARLTSLRSQAALLVGASARFDLGGPFSFGGSGWLLTDPVEVSTGDAGSGLRLKVAYGGVLAGWDVAERSGARGTVRVLVGAGNAKVVLPVVETEIASDNFLVVEPSLAAVLTLKPWVGLLGEVAYRWSVGVEDLPGVAGDQVRGISASLGVAIGPF